MKYLWVVTLLLMASCFSQDNFDPEAEIFCMRDDDCPFDQGEVRVCVNGFCGAPYFADSNELATELGPFNETETVNGVGKGTLRLGEIGHESVFRAQATSGQQAEIAIRGDDIIINGTLVAQSPNTTIKIQARNRIWIRKGVALRSSASGSGDSIRFVLQADEAMYIDEGVSLDGSADGFCTCLFDNARPRSSYGSEQCGQCIPLAPLNATQ